MIEPIPRGSIADETLITGSAGRRVVIVIYEEAFRGWEAGGEY